MRYLSVSKLRATLPEVAGTVERTVVTRNGEPVSVLLHVDDFRALQAAQALAGRPRLLTEALEAHERVQRDELSGFEELEEIAPGAGRAVSAPYAEAWRTASMVAEPTVPYGAPDEQEEEEKEEEEEAAAGA